MVPSEPAPYSPTDTAEVESVATLKGLIDLNRIKCDIKERDKFPNIDGYLELVSTDLRPIGKLEVQVKKLNEDRIDRPRHDLETSFFGYVMNVSCYPAIIISVDTINKRAYWFHISEDFIRTLSLNLDQKTKLIEYPIENCIDGTNNNYFDKWSEIARQNKRKILDYDKIKKISDIVKRSGNSILEEKSKRIKEINYFLELYNSKLYKDYNIIKKVYYPNSRSLGFLFKIYEDDRLIYGLYPINYDENVLPIKYIEDATIFRDQSSHFSAYLTENPVKNRPQVHVYEILQEKLSVIFEHKLLSNENEFLATEYIFAFIDIFKTQMGLDEKNIYSIDEIEYGLNIHLPFWIMEAVQFMVEVKRNRVREISDCLRGRPYFDPQFLNFQIMDAEKQLILDRVKIKIDQKTQVPVVPVGNDRFPVGLFWDFILFLKFNNHTEISRPYAIKDNWGTADWVWGQFSQENLRINMNIFFNKLKEVYDEIVKNNFEHLSDQLLFEKDMTKMMVLYEDKEEYKTEEDAPSMDIYALNSETPEEFQILTLKKEDMPDLDPSEPEGEIAIEGVSYQYRLLKRSILDFIFDETPMLNYVYNILHDKINALLD